MLTSFFWVALVGFITITFFYLVILFGQKNSSFKLFINLYFKQIRWLLFFFHLSTAFFLGGEVADVKLFATAGYALAHKIDIYWLDPQGGTYSFFPLMIFPYSLFWYISDRLPILTFSFLVKLLLIPVMFLTSRFFKSRIHRLLFLTNPVIFLTVTLHGQADLALIFFFILSIYYLEKPAKAGIFMAISIMIKTWSVMFLPLVFFKLKSFRFWISFGISFLIIGFLYKFFVFSSWQRILTALIVHPSGSAGYWGITALLKLVWPSTVQFYSINRFWPLLASLVFGWWIAWKKKLTIFPAALLLILLTYVTTAGWGLQYSSWIIPFGILAQDFKKTNLYTLLSLPYLCIAYLGIAANAQVSPNNLVIFLSLPAWLFSIYWLTSFVKKQSRGN